MTWKDFEKLLWFIPDRMYLNIKYRVKMGEWCDLANPQTFNEKMQWLKLNDRKPQYISMVDKVLAKEFISKVAGGQYVIPTLGVWDRFDDIDFSMLPQKFVLKTNHDNGGIVFCRDKETFEISKARALLNSHLANNYFFYGREWPYKYVERKILAEELLTDGIGDLCDYKVFNFEGIPHLIEVDFDRFSEHKRNIYTIDWEKMDVEIEYPADHNRELKRPKCLDEMLDVAKKLSSGTRFLRTDFFISGERLYVGELTLYHESGFGKIVPKSFDRTLGDLISLS